MQRYASRIIKAGALLPETRVLLAHWDATGDVRANLNRIQSENLFGKASRSRVQDILREFRHRYLCDPEVLAAIARLARAGMPVEALDRILYFEAARADPLLHDAVVELLLPLSGQPGRDVQVWEVQSWLAEQVDTGRTEAAWSDYVELRVARGLLSTLRDFGILEGASKKRIAQVYLPIKAFVFIAFQLSWTEGLGDRLVRSPEWKLFFLSELAVERFFLEAQQEGLLTYQAAGSVKRVDFPVQTLPEYASVLTQSTY